MLSRRHLACLVLVVLSPMAHAAGTRARTGSDTGSSATADVQEAARVLVERWSRDEGANVRELLEWSARVGGPGVSALFAELGEMKDRRRDLTTVASLSRALESLPAVAADAVLGVGSDPSAESYRASGLWVLAHLGTYTDVGRAFNLSTTPGEQPASPATLDALEAALGGIFMRSPTHVGHVRDFMGTIDAAQKTRLIRALGRCPSGHAFAMLGELLAGNEAFHATILAQMGRIANATQPASEVRSIARMRELLHSSDLRVSSEAALTLGKVEDMESLDALIDLLDHPDERLSANAHWALMRISGRRFRPESRRWAAWHAAEREWWSTRGQELLETLRSGAAGEVSTALNELATHKLYRHSIAQALRPLLGDRRNDIVLLSCSALYSLRSAAALPELLAALSHPDTRIRESALRALQSTTGLDLPLDPDGWSQALDAEL